MRKVELGQISFGAFPRSGNHLLGITLVFGFPKRRVFWLEHRITDLSKAENCAVIVRNPLSSIASWMECNSDERPNAAERICDWYIRYMNGVLNAQDRLVVFRFEDLVASPDLCAVFFAERFGLESPAKVKKKKVEAWLKENQPSNFPSEITKAKEKRYDAVRYAPRFGEAQDAYGEVLAISQIVG
jgi:hypothetical protein